MPDQGTGGIATLMIFEAALARTVRRIDWVVDWSCNNAGSTNAMH